jgi:tungstate transport system ATP-binding protein
VDIKNLSIFPGELFAIIGPSGSGKSTLLRLMNFLEEPSSGDLEFAGYRRRAGVDVPLELRRCVTMVFQRPLLLNRSVWDNVIYGLRLRGIRNSYHLVQQTLEEVGLEYLSHQQVKTLSGGEVQRVALARAIVLRPEVLLLDEPTANLDPYNVALIEKIMVKLNEQHRTTVILVTHNIFQAKRLAGRVAFLLDGQLVEVADTETLFSAPADERTAAFVSGEMVY